MSPAAKPVRRTLSERTWFIFVGTEKRTIVQADDTDTAARRWLKGAYGTIAKMAAALNISETDAEELYVVRSVLNPMAYAVGDIIPGVVVGNEEEFSRLRTEIRSRGLGVEQRDRGYEVTEGANRWHDQDNRWHDQDDMEIA